MLQEETNPYGPCGRRPMSCDSINYRFFRRFNEPHITNERKKRCRARADHPFYKCMTVTDENDNFLRCEDLNDEFGEFNEDELPPTDRRMPSRRNASAQTSARSGRMARRNATTSARRNASASARPSASNGRRIATTSARSARPQASASASAGPTSARSARPSASAQTSARSGRVARRNASAVATTQPLLITPYESPNSTIEVGENYNIQQYSSPSPSQARSSSVSGSTRRSTSMSATSTSDRQVSASASSGRVNRQASARSAQPSASAQTSVRENRVARSAPTSASAQTSVRNASVRENRVDRNASARSAPTSNGPAEAGPASAQTSARSGRVERNSQASAVTSLSQAYTMEAYSDTLYDKMYIGDNERDDLFKSIQYYLVWYGDTTNQLLGNVVDIKNTLGMRNKRKYSDNDVMKVAMTYNVCIFVWNFRDEAWYMYGDVFTCTIRIPLFLENGRYGYLLKKNSSSTNTSPRSVRRNNRSRSARQVSARSARPSASASASARSATTSNGRGNASARNASAQTQATQDTQQTRRSTRVRRPPQRYSPSNQ